MYRPAAISRHLQCTAHFRQAYNPFSSLCSFPSFQVEPVQKSWHAQAIQAGKLVSFSLKFSALSRCLECVAGKLRKLGMICWKAQNGPKNLNISSMQLSSEIRKTVFNNPHQCLSGDVDRFSCKSVLIIKIIIINNFTCMIYI